ncbi:MAG: ADP-heptose synthase [Micrococcales bacterium]|nr:ADP-heptose synthase [Micrococcales bacterium]
MPRPNKSVFVSGNFFIIHPGHVRFLRFASECGNRLIVGVHDTQPSVSFPAPHERCEVLRSLGFVDEVVILKDGLEKALCRLKPDIVVKGKEYERTSNPEEALLKHWSGSLLFSSGDSTYSATELLGSSSGPGIAWARPRDYMRRHGIELDRSRRIVASFSDLSVVVIGDLIVDEYVSCEALGMSREDPTVVVSPQQTDRFLGGAGIVAAHAARLGASTKFLSVAGADDVGEWAKHRLNDFGVDAMIVGDDSRPTTLKQRYRVGSKTMLRVSHLRQHEVSKTVADRLKAALLPLIPRTKLLVFADFNYGCLPQELVDSLISSARKSGVTVVADSQSSSQLGDISRFRHVDLLTPTEREARLALRAQSESLPVLGSALLDRAFAKRALVTLGEAGVMVFDRALDGSHLQVDQLPALNRRPVDVSGAGDSMLIVASMALASGSDGFEAAYIGSVASAIQTSRVGNIPITMAEIREAFH